jgi:hypothetical protein
MRQATLCGDLIAYDSGLNRTGGQWVVGTPVIRCGQPVSRIPRNRSAAAAPAGLILQVVAPGRRLIWADSPRLRFVSFNHDFRHCYQAFTSRPPAIGRADRTLPKKRCGYYLRRSVYHLTRLTGYLWQRLGDQLTLVLSA